MLDHILTTYDDEIVRLAASAVLVLVGWVLRWAKRYLAARELELLRRIFDEALSRGVTYGLARPSDLPQVEAVDYLQRNIPDTIRQLGVSQTTMLERANIEVAQRRTAAR